MKSVWVQRLVRAKRRHGLFRERGRFFVNELFATSAPRRYTLTGGPKVVLRPGTRDTDILQEIFAAPGMYAAPAPIAEAIGSKPSNILDLGGNIGLFALDALARYPTCSVTSYEPDRTNLPLLGRNIELNELDGRWRLERCCISNRAGTLNFASGQFADSQVTPDGPDKVPCEDLFALAGHFALIKIDIEGSEWDILYDERLPSIPSNAIVLEWHAHACPEMAPKHVAIRQLRAAGFDVLEGEDAQIAGTLWAWRPSTGSR